jgi:hypothetical protein
MPIWLPVHQVRGRSELEVFAEYCFETRSSNDLDARFNEHSVAAALLAEETVAPAPQSQYRLSVSKSVSTGIGF